MNLKAYPEYKDSEVEWIGDIPESWETQKMKNLIFFQEGPGLRHWQFRSDGIRVICVTNITEKGINFSNYEKFISEEEYWHSYKHFTVEKGDLLLSSSGNSWGKVAEYLSDETVILNTSTIRINENQIDKKVYRKFLKWALKSDSVREQLGLMMTGSCQPNFGPSHLSEAMMCYPNLDEQIQINTYLDKKTSEIDLTIEKDTKLIELLKEKRTTLINHVVTKGLDPAVKMKDSGVEWIGEIPEDCEVKKLKHIIKPSGLIRGPFGSSIKTEFFVKKGYKVYEQKNSIKNDPFIGNSYVDENKYNELIRFSVKENDIIMSCSGTIGKIVRIPLDYDPGIINQALLIMRFTNDIEIPFFEYIFGSDFIQNQIIDNSQGSAMKNLVGMNIFKNIRLILPSKSEQEKIIVQLDKKTSKIDLTIQKTQDKIHLLEEYKKSLIHHVVTGKVDVREVDV